MNLQMVHCLDQLHNLNLERIEPANRAPTEYFVPFFEILEANCHNVTPLLRVAHQPHTSKSHPLTGAVERDELFFTAWKDAKGNIEDFQSIVDRIEAYQDLLSSRSKGTNYIIQRSHGNDTGKQNRLLTRGGWQKNISGIPSNYMWAICHSTNLENLFNNPTLSEGVDPGIHLLSPLAINFF
jgi:hypothetical protein